MTQHKAITTRLDIVGFKSFADEIHFDILPGLTGIVGPNGCGKSNIVEALRWTMGESSARALRGGESDDLIFAGTGSRPARNLARVTLHLGEATGLAPAPFQQAAELEVSRQAERGSGSTYRINNRVMRARDVQTIFADLSSGARSSSIISQNRVSQLIAAKPEERRSLLEEAAGITGLYVRRRDAELKLRQAESNLERAEEHRQTLDQQLSTLSGQSEKAQRYRILSEEIRGHERDLLILQHARADQLVQSRRATLEKAREGLQKSEAALEKAQSSLDVRIQERKQQEEKLAILRPKLEQHRIHIEVAQASLQHQQQASEDHNRQKAQLEADLTRQKEELTQLEAQRTQTRQTLAEFTKKRQELEEQEPVQNHQIVQLRGEEKKQQAEYASLTSRHQEARLQHERLQSREQALAKQIADEQAQLETLKAELAQITQACEENTPSQATRQALAKALEEATEQEQQARDTDALFQEERLLSERAERDVREARNRLDHLQQRKTELTQSQTRQQARLLTEQEQSRQTHAALLSDEARKDLHDACLEAQQHAKKASKTEKWLREKRQEAEQFWLKQQAEQEKRQQRRGFLQQEITRLEEILGEQKIRVEKAQKILKKNRSQAIPQADLVSARQALAQLDKQLTAHKKELEKSEKALATCLDQQKVAQSSLQETESELLRQRGEHEGLQQSLQGSLKAIAQPVLEQLHIPDDLTNAFASALTDGLEASLPKANETLADTPRQWRNLPGSGPAKSKTSDKTKDPTLASLPALATLIEAPAPLNRALGAIFLLDDAGAGPELQTRLKPGQAIVTKEGTLWRWDGFIRHPNGSSPEMIRLQQAQTLKKIRQRIEELTSEQTTRRRASKSLKAKREKLEGTLSAQHSEHGKMTEARSRQQHQLEGLEQRHALQQEQLALLTEEANTHARQYERTDAQSKEAEQELASLPESTGDLSHNAAILQKAREEEQAARRDVELAQRAQQEAETTQKQALYQHEARLVRLAELKNSITQLEQELKNQQTQLQNVQKEHDGIDLSRLQDKLTSIQAGLEKARESAAKTAESARVSRKAANEQDQALQEQTRHLTGLQARKESLAQQLQTSTQSLQTRQQEIKTCRESKMALPDINALEKTRLEAGQQLEQTQRTLRQNLTIRNELQQELSLLRERREHLQADSQQQDTRHGQIEAMIKDLVERHAALLKAAPAQADESGLSRHEGQLQQDMDALKGLEEQEETLKETLAETLKDVQEQQTLLDHHKEKGSRYKEESIRLGERLEQAQEALALLRHDSPLPEDAEEPKSVSAEAEQSTKQALRRAMRQREALGPVNLCAEEEYRTAREEAERIAREHQDLSTAISRLRGGVGTINREGRQRLMAVFADINEHFQTFFTRMFSGGKAHLQMVGSDDPLEAGLEIFAQPPGKKLSTLSLLSGGEQALTALSLIFAAFYCTPAPICVLDEVDAPLDDANVERFCTLLRDITQRTGTRFLVVTHHQLTMAHMDRLYGITMQERGVSRLLSVNLDESIRMVNG